MARLLEINACDRATGTPANCTFRLDRPIVGRYRLAWLQVPFVQPSEVASRKSLILNVGGTLIEIFFSEPVYTPAQLVAELQARLNAEVAPIGLVFTVVLDSTNRIVISRNNTTVVTFYGRKDFNANALAINNKLAGTLGIVDDIILTGAASTTISFPNGINLASPLSYHISINKDIQVETTTGARATFSVPIDVNSFEVINYKAREHVDQIVSFPDLTRVLAIKWTDNEGFDLERHQNWSLLLEKV